MPAGRPSTYNEKLHPKLVLALAQQGLTDEQIAERMDISHDTLYRWYREHEELAEAKKTGSKNPDDMVEASLFQRAIGYSHPAVKIFMPAGASEPVYAPFIEHYPPDTAAGIWWTKNRRPDRWRDRREDTTIPDIPPVRIHISGKPDPSDLDTIKNDNLEVSRGKA